MRNERGRVRVVDDDLVMVDPPGLQAYGSSLRAIFLLEIPLDAGQN